MNINKEFELDISNSQNSNNYSSNGTSEFNEYNNDIPSSSNETLNFLKNNINNNLLNNNYSRYKKPQKNSYVNNIINSVIYNQELLNQILNYLNIIDLSNFRAVNRPILNLIHIYFKTRFNIELQSIINYQNKNKNLIISYMNHIDEQIPLTTNNWLNLNLQKNLLNLNILNQQLISNIINTNNSLKIPDTIYKSLLIIIGFNDKSIINKEEINWQKFSSSILSLTNIIQIINNIDYENINDIEIMKILKILNDPKLSINSVKKVSEDYAKLILWFQSVVSFHILIHPYIYRNRKGSVHYNSKEYCFAKEMEKKIESFYKLKRFLRYLNVININIGEYVFTIQQSNNHNGSPRKKNGNKKKYFNLENNNNIDIYDSINDYKIIGIILSFISFKDSYKLRSVSKSFLNGFKYSINILLFLSLKDLYNFRSQTYNEYNEQVSMIYSHNIFSRFFLMLDNILNESSSNYELISKEVIDELKILKSKNEYIYDISKIFFDLTEIKVNKINNDSKRDYIGALRMLSVKGELLKIMKSCNKLHLNKRKINSIYQELKKFFNLKILKRIKSMNRSIFCLLIWEIIFLQYLRIYNIFDFINYDNIKNNDNTNQTKLIDNFIKIMNNLKYILKIRYHFYIKDKSKKETLYGFKESMENLNDYLNEQNLEYKYDILSDSNIETFKNIGSSYFNNISNKNHKFTQDVLPFYERIVNEIIIFYTENSFNEKSEKKYIINTDIKNNKENKNNYFKDINSLSTINDKNYNLSSINNKKYNNTVYTQRKSPIINKTKSFNRINLFKNKTCYSSIINQKTNKKSKSKILIISDNIFIKTIFFYIDLTSLAKFGMSNKKFLCCFRIHMLIRLNYINKNLKNFEEDNKGIINLINNKRNFFYSTYDINPPNKEHAIKLINKLKLNDIQELKQYFKKYNEIYLTIVIPFLLLLKQKSLTQIKNNGNYKMLYFEEAKNILYFSSGNNLIKLLNALEIELIPSNIINKVNELLINNEHFKPDNMKKFNPCFSNVISWVIGILELYKILRKYSLNSYDYEIFDKKEIKFCKKIDDIIFNYYKVLRYTNYFCKEYENKAKDIMHQMNIFI